MATNAFRALIDIDPISRLTDPPAVVYKDAHAAVITPSASELDGMAWDRRYNGPHTMLGHNGTQTPVTPNELEMSRPPSPRNDDAVDVVQSFSNPPMNRFRVPSACLMCFGNGLNDSAPGALIPYIEENYKIGYAIVSLIFVANALGFISAVPFTNALGNRLGRANLLILAEALMILGYIMLICTPPFPIVVVAFFFIGLGYAFNLAPNNVFCANLTNATATLGFFHGSYGVGGTIGPLIATALVTRGHRWSTFYFLSLGITALNLVFAAWAFWTYEADLPTSFPHCALNTRGTSQSSPSSPLEKKMSDQTSLKASLRNKTTLLGALFIFAYQGAEVSISGWVISFLLAYRHSSPSSTGFVTAGFWAGITLGRFALSQPAHLLGEKLAVVLLTCSAITFQLIVWLVPSFIGEAVAVAVLGLVLGPVYPCATVVFSKLLPRKLQMSGLSFVTAMGSSGGAVAPFMTGLVAQKTGTFVLHPICVGLFTGMLACWLALPRIGAKRRD